MSPALKRFVIYSGAVLVVALAYYAWLVSALPKTPENETWLSELGEGLGEFAMWLFIFIYVRTGLKLLLGKGPMARRLLPEYKAPSSLSGLQRVIALLDRTHIYFGVAAVAFALIHIGLMGLHLHILSFPLVLALVIWQAAFGSMLTWRGAPSSAKRWSYAVHAQLVTGVAIGVFAYLGHLLIDD